MVAQTFLVVAAFAATSFATLLHVDIGCIKVGGTHQVCASDDPYSINAGTAQITCRLDANPTFVTVSWPEYYGDVYWTAEDCLVDAQGIKLGCAPAPDQKNNCPCPA